ncbi:MAG: hypothetical protein ACREE7_16125 [Dongiaceae bacterium]
MRALTAIAFVVFAGVGAAQDSPPRRMTQENLHAIIAEAAQDVRAEGNVVVFRLGETQLLCISDTFADRMRIIAPIKRLEEATAEELLAALQANFHTVLDARYAVSNGIIFAAYLHPLSSLTREQIVSAMHQVAAARASFGTDYSSGGPVFGGVR